MAPDVYMEYENPPIGQSITRFDHCPCFAERRSLLAPDPICWFCRFAAFDLFSDKLPENGMCKYPEEQKRSEIRKARDNDEHLSNSSDKVRRK